MPTRTCVGCRRTAEQSELVRVVADEAGRIRIGGPRRAGRGAYLHRDRSCVEEAFRRGALPRALKRNLVSLEVGEAWRRVERATDEEVSKE